MLHVDNAGCMFQVLYLLSSKDGNLILEQASDATER